MSLFFRKSIGLGLFCLLVFPMKSVYAQQWEYGATLGTSGYMGEYNPSKPYLFNSFAAGIGVKYNWNSSWGTRANLNYIGIKGDAGAYVKPSFSNPDFSNHFRSKSLYELNVMQEFNFFEYNPSTKRNAYSPYVMAGVGYRLDKHPYGFKNRLSLPFGAGFKYNLKSSFSLDARLVYRLTTDAMIDDYNGRVELGVEKANFFERMNNSDGYMTFQVGVTYTLFETGCPTW